MGVPVSCSTVITQMNQAHRKQQRKCCKSRRIRGINIFDVLPEHPECRRYRFLFHNGTRLNTLYTPFCEYYALRPVQLDIVQEIHLEINTSVLVLGQTMLRGLGYGDNILVDKLEVIFSGLPNNYACHAYEELRGIFSNKRIKHFFNRVFSTFFLSSM